jgi:hypothetical protein
MTPFWHLRTWVPLTVIAHVGTRPWIVGPEALDAVRLLISTGRRLSIGRSVGRVVAAEGCGRVSTSISTVIVGAIAVAEASGGETETHSGTQGAVPDAAAIAVATSIDGEAGTPRPASQGGATPTERSARKARSAAAETTAAPTEAASTETASAAAKAASAATGIGSNRDHRESSDHHG